MAERFFDWDGHDIEEGDCESREAKETELEVDENADQDKGSTKSLDDRISFPPLFEVPHGDFDLVTRKSRHVVTGLARKPAFRSFDQKKVDLKRSEVNTVKEHLQNHQLHPGRLRLILLGQRHPPEHQKSRNQVHVLGNRKSRRVVLVLVLENTNDAE